MFLRPVWAILAAIGATGCNLIARFSDCQSDFDCPSGQVCNDTRHFCQRDTAEMCNGTDDDHDGVTDVLEDFGPCRVATRPGAGCRDGQQRCSGSAISCLPNTAAMTETCSNGIDDDCNGITDDGARCMQQYPAITATAPLQIGSGDPAFGEGDDAPQHGVCLASFSIDRYEVSTAAFLRYLNAQPAGQLTVDTPTPVYGGAPREHYIVLAGEPVVRIAPEARSGLALQVSQAHGWRAATAAGANLPMVNVTWYGADGYCRWAGKHLPTEAEWWRAARGASGQTAYPWGNETPTCARANLGVGGPADGGSCVGNPVAVDSLAESGNPEGVLHLYGNAQEWMFDWLNEGIDRMQNNYYQAVPADGWCSAFPTGPVGPDAGTSVSAPGVDAGLACVACRFARGRSYGSTDVRPGIRARLDRDRGDDFTGFRCATGGAPR